MYGSRNRWIHGWHWNYLLLVFFGILLAGGNGS